MLLLLNIDGDWGLGPIPNPQMNKKYKSVINLIKIIYYLNKNKLIVFII